MTWKLLESSTYRGGWFELMQSEFSQGLPSLLLIYEHFMLTHLYVEQLHWLKITLRWVSFFRLAPNKRNGKAETVHVAKDNEVKHRSWINVILVVELNCIMLKRLPTRCKKSRIYFPFQPFELHEFTEFNSDSDLHKVFFYFKLAIPLQLICIPFKWRQYLHFRRHRGNNSSLINQHWTNRAALISE